MSLPLACLGQRADLLGQEIDRLHGPVTLVRRCADLVELLAVVRSGLALAVLIDDDEPELSATVIDSLLQDGAVVSVVVDWSAGLLETLSEGSGGKGSEQESSERRPEPPRRPDWGRLGAEEISADQPARQAAQLLIDASQRPRPEGQGRSAGDGSEGPDASCAPQGRSEPRRRTGLQLDPDDEGFDPAPDDEARPQHGPERTVLPPRGRVVAVWGPHGSPGRSTVAVNLAAECAQQGALVTLVDLDTWGPSVAALLGLLDETAGVALACRAADRDRLTPDALERAAVQVQVGRSPITVLTGLTRPERWPELRAGSVQRLLRACQHMPRAEQLAAGSAAGSEAAPGPAPVIVVDVGFSLEEDEELISELEAPRRSAATTAALAEADLVLAVCSAEVLGIPRAARSLPALLEATPAPVMLVANRVRRSATGSAPRSALREAWAAVGAPGQWDAHLSWEPKTLDAAALAGSVLAESAPSSALRGQLRDLASSVLRRLDGRFEEPADVGEAEDVRGTRLGRALGGRKRR